LAFKGLPIIFQRAQIFACGEGFVMDMKGEDDEDEEDDEEEPDYW
jgi:hypothetical protein